MKKDRHKSTFFEVLELSTLGIGVTSQTVDHSWALGAEEAPARLLGDGLVCFLVWMLVTQVCSLSVKNHQDAQLQCGHFSVCLASTESFKRLQ